MHFSFLSIVTVLNNKADILQIEKNLGNVQNLLKDHFKDFEIILVNNTLEDDFYARIKLQHPSYYHGLSILHLSRPIDQNNAVVAGMDQANGDYVVLLETRFYDTPGLILDLFQKTQEEYDVVYLRSKHKEANFLRRFIISIFCTIFKKYSGLSIDEKALDSRIISRRSINSILKLRENLRYMKAIFSLVGYKTAFIEVDSSIINSSNWSSELRMYIRAITSFTDFLQVLLKWIFTISFILFLGATTNAVIVKLLHFDLLGTPQHAVSGWAFLVILISFTFSILCLILYIMTIYLSGIYQEIKQRPLYIIESIKRF